MQRRLQEVEEAANRGVRMVAFLLDHGFDIE